MDGKGIKRLADEHNVRSFWIFGLDCGLDCKLVCVCKVSVWTAVAGIVLVLLVILMVVVLLELVQLLLLLLLLDVVIEGGLSEVSVTGGIVDCSDLFCVVNHFPRHSVEQYSFPTSLFSTIAPVVRSFLHQSHLRLGISYIYENINQHMQTRGITFLEIKKEKQNNLKDWNKSMQLICGKSKLLP